jgi:hypothetical protein
VINCSSRVEDEDENEDEDDPEDELIPPFIICHLFPDT